MSTRSFLSALLLAACASAVHAADQTVQFAGDGASFLGVAPVLQGGDDVI